MDESGDDSVARRRRGIPKVIANSLIVMKKTGHWALPYWREQQNAIEDGTCTRKPEFKGSSGPIADGINDRNA